MVWVGLSQSADGLGWIGSHKIDPWTTLTELDAQCNINLYTPKNGSNTKNTAMHTKRKQRPSLSYVGLNDTLY